ncbi:glucose-1-phosphate cytidylyltransferase [Paenibacillus sp. JDR-2]|uniref:glucose-1-phosphate cytidylyltransferase n=1 Tax=Paenibacillus sp. (strain JDR-2) TaxID=324057 RepID=UPI000166B5A9|nr:glucose-1-phosphate cytidylyltransferase [Paenibacillus sp. JDR-2]ACT02472.1 glucose-1-phosphate cytidylyltransferase [Paenibacillus sp. JDR-2]
MKAVILAGGLGSRLSEETISRPKPMVEIGGKPILWHIMKIYSQYGIHDFIIAAGYKSYVIKEYFMNYYLHQSDVHFDLSDNRVTLMNSKAEPWKITVVDTGEQVMTGGRLKRLAPYIGDESFCFTYGDGVGDIQINELLALHRSKGKLATVTAVNPGMRYGILEIEDQKAVTFKEKPHNDKHWINGGFFVLEPKVIELIRSDETVWEHGPLESLASFGELSVYQHQGFWHSMDTLRDKNELNELWNKGNAPWKVWK